MRRGVVLLLLLVVTVAATAQRRPRTIVESGSILLNERESLTEIADKTGGATAWGANIVQLLARIAEDLESLPHRAKQSNFTYGLLRLDDVAEGH